MEYNEPLNLSVKKKPIAVVIPSSSTTNNKVDGTGTGSSGSLSNDADDPSERLDTSASPSGGLNDSDNVNRSTPMPHLDDTNTCHNATIDLVSVRPCPPTLNTRALLYVSVCTCNAVNQMNVLHMQSKPNQTIEPISHCGALSSIVWNVNVRVFCYAFICFSLRIVYNLTS